MPDHPTPLMSVDDVLRRWPAAIGPLDALAVDSCCGGAATLSEAAADAGVPVSRLLEAIERALDVEAGR